MINNININIRNHKLVFVIYRLMVNLRIKNKLENIIALIILLMRKRRVYVYNNQIIIIINKNPFVNIIALIILQMRYIVKIKYKLILL